MERKTITIYTIYGLYNYGNRLQLFALQKYLKNLTNDSFEINSTKIINNHPNFKARIKNFIFYKRIHNFKRFDKNISYANQSINFGKIKNPENFDYYIVGSDQIWNSNFPDFGAHFLLKDIPPKKRVAYAASFGVNHINQKFHPLFYNELKQFKSISVREKRGQKLVEELSGRKDAELLIDPTLLIDTKEWDKVAQKPKWLKTDKFIFLYFLGKISTERYRKIQNFAKKHNFRIVDTRNKFSPAYTCGPAEFLYLEKHASLICTDSFHSSVFAFLFDRPLAIFRREDTEADMFSRLETLTDTFSLRSCVCEDNQLDDSFLQHDYSTGYKRLVIERKKSEAFLKNALEINA